MFENAQNVSNGNPDFNQMRLGGWSPEEAANPEVFLLIAFIALIFGIASIGGSGRDRN